MRIHNQRCPCAGIFQIADREAKLRVAPLAKAGCCGTGVVFSALAMILRSVRNGEGLPENEEEIVLVTVKQYLAVADDVLRKLFPELPASFWANSDQYPSCSVCIKEDDDSPPN